MNDNEYEKFRDRQIREWDRRALGGRPPPHLEKAARKSCWHRLVDYLRGRSKERSPL